MSLGTQRLSGIQKEVFSLYRSLLRSAKKKEGTGMDLPIHNLIRKKFREEALSIKRNQYQLIEHKIRYGHKQIKLIESPGFSSVRIV